MKKQLKLAAMILVLMSIAFTGCDSGGGGGDDTDTTDYAALVSVDAASLDVNYGGTDSASSVTRNVALPLYGDHDTVITWSSSDETTIYWTENNIDYCSINGNVDRPEFAAGDKTVTLTAVISKGGASETRQFVLTVKRMPGTDLQSVTEDAANLEVQYAPGDSASSVTQNVFLETDGNCGTVITWSSSLTSTISNAGAVTRPAFLSGNETVTLTAVITKGSESSTRVFNLTVIETPPTDAQAVAEDKAALAIIYAAGESAAHVKNNITLPSTGTCGTVITWSSSNTAVVSNTGVVTATSTAVTVTVTATITRGSASDTKVFTLTVVLAYNLRDIGPAGGLIFYINPNAAADGWTYLEAAPASTEWTGKVWGGYNTLVTGADGTAIGTGKQNTIDIVTQFGASEPYASRTDYAAKLCSDLVSGGYDDWFLPSRDELNAMYVNLKSQGVGDFTNYLYCSSSEVDANNAWIQSFSYGNQGYDHKFGNPSVRAVRAF
ncbi:MAG: DUF1566 domain-containing protein [Spirochaetes bacterium]|nr:DUF1566 domain-containing protein [Spirochaetota bacterium]